MADRDLVVHFIGDDHDLQQAFRRSERGAGRFEASVSRTGTAGAGLGRAFAGYAAAVISAEAIRRVLVASITSASDLNAQIARTEIILEGVSQETIDWSRTSATAFGLSQRAALGATTTFASLFKAVDIGTQRAAILSRGLVELSADLAAFTNTNPEEVLIALRSGLAGANEPLRRYDIFLTAARVQQEAMAVSGKKNVKELTNQEKILARYNLILRDAAPAQGAFTRTSGDLAQQAAILRANLDNLASTMGSVLVPVLEDAITEANKLFIVLDKFRGVDFSPKFDVPGLDTGAIARTAAGVVPGLGPVVEALGRLPSSDDEASDLEKAVRRTEAVRRGEAAARIAAHEKEQAREAARAALEAGRARRRSLEAFDELVKGLGLKLDRATLTASLEDDLAALRELERAIQRQIRREGRTFELIESLTQVRLDISSTTAERSERAAEHARDAWRRTLDALDLNLERASDTPQLEDDLRALNVIERTIQRRIAQEGKTLELERELLDVRRQQAEVRRQQAEQLRQQREEERQARQGRQFQRLGLTEEGDEPVPGTGALRKRAARLEEQIKGSVLDTDKTRSRLRRIAQVLSGQFGDVGREVRQAILDMLNDITSALEGGDRKGPLTKGSGLNTLKVLEGLGLSEEQIRELRGRLSSVTGQATQIGAPTRTTGGLDGFGGIQGRILVESHTTINLDGQKVASVVTRNQQRTKRRNPKQKRGPNRGL